MSGCAACGYDGTAAEHLCDPAALAGAPDAAVTAERDRMRETIAELRRQVEHHRATLRQMHREGLTKGYERDMCEREKWLFEGGEDE